MLSGDQAQVDCAGAKNLPNVTYNPVFYFFPDGDK